MRRGLGLWIIAGIGGFVVANGCGTMDEEQQGEGVLAELALEQLCPALAEALCDAKASCACFDASARSLCVAAERSSCEATTSARTEDGQQGYNPSAARQCIDQLAAAASGAGQACDLDPVWPPICGDVFSGGGTEGSPCTELSGCVGDVECSPCVPGLECRNGQCHLLPGDGEACHPEHGCASGTRCVDEICRTTLPEGHACTTSDECNLAAGLYCAPRPVCAARPLLGEPCSFDTSAPERPTQGNCEEGLFCSADTGTCQQRLGADGSCGATDECSDEYYCQPPVDNTSPGGTCKPRLLDQSTPCMSDEQCSLGYFCSDEMSADGRRCIAAREPSQECDRDAQCAGDAGCRGVTTTCVSLPNVIGAPCGDTLLCAPSAEEQPLFCSAGEGHTCQLGTGEETRCHVDSNGNYRCQPGLYCDTSCAAAEGCPECRPAPGVDADCSAVGVCAAGAYCLDGNCREGSGVEAACDPFESTFGCQPGLYCDFESFSCQPAPPIGADCSYAQACEVNAACVTEGQCTPPGAQGENCEPSCYGWIESPSGPTYLSSTRPPCGPELFCQVVESTGVCTPVATAGSICDASACESSCALGQYCRGELRCAGFPDGGAGAACDWNAGCPAEYYCDWDGECGERLGEGAQCEPWTLVQQCGSGLWCSIFVDEPEPRCVARLPDGYLCDPTYPDPMSPQPMCLGDCIEYRCANAPVRGICAADARPF